jgi:Uma2 family endonuclease
MNAPVIPAPMRRRFTTADVLRMAETGLLKPQERVELIDGELTLMSPKHNKHEWLKARLVRWLSRRLPDELILAVESTLYLDERSFVEPNLMIYCADLMPEDVRGPDVRLAIEIADSSLAFDLNVKAPLYARHGVAHYWAIDAETLQTTLHAAPGGDGYGDVRTLAKDAALALPFALEATLSLGALT